MTDQPPPPGAPHHDPEADATRLLGGQQGPAPAGPTPYADPLAEPPSGVPMQPQLTARPRGSTSLPRSTLVMLGVALLVVGGVVGALVGHTVGRDDGGPASADGRGLRPGSGLPGGGFGQGGPGQGQQGRADNQFPGGAGGGFASGTVTAVDGGTVTIKTQDGRTVKVKVSDSTSVSVTTQGTSADVKVGERVLATGRTGSDGTMTAGTLRVGDQLGVDGPGRSADGAATG